MPVSTSKQPLVNKFVRKESGNVTKHESLLCEHLLTIGPTNPRPVSDKITLIYSPTRHQKSENTILPSTVSGETFRNF